MKETTQDQFHNLAQEEDGGRWRKEAMRRGQVWREEKERREEKGRGG